MKIGGSLTDDLWSFADQEAKRRGTSRSGLLAQLLSAERVGEQARRYLDRYAYSARSASVGLILAAYLAGR